MAKVFCSKCYWEKFGYPTTGCCCPKNLVVENSWDAPQTRNKIEPEVLNARNSCPYFKRRNLWWYLCYRKRLRKPHCLRWG